MIDSIRVQRFKSIEDAFIELAKVTILVGPNNAGKSSVLQAVQFAVSVAQSLKLDGTASWKGGALAGSLSTQQLVYTPLRDVQALAAGGTLRQGDDTAIAVSFAVGGDESAIATVKRGKNRNIAIKIDGQSIGEQLAEVETPFSVVSPGLAGIPSYEEYKSPGLVRRAAARGDANSVFRNVLWTLRQDPPGWKEFTDALAEVFSDIKVDVDFNEQTDEFIHATVTREGVVLPIDAAGTGVLQAIQVLSYVSVYKPKLLVLDEPDSHLHPDNQRKLLRLIARQAAERDFQVLLSSHSRHVIDEAADLDAKVIWFSDGQVQPGTFDEVKALLELGALDAGDRLRNGSTSLIVLTEDQNFDWLRPLVESSGITPNEYDIWSYKGSSEVKFATILAAFIAAHAAGTRVVVHRDRDYLDDSEVAAFEESIKKAGATPFITTGTDIESHFLESAHLRQIFPELDPQLIDDLLDRATEDKREQSEKNMINARSEFRLVQQCAGVQAPSVGSIAQGVPGDFRDNPQRFRHGKFTMRVLQRLIQEETGTNRPINRASPALSTEPFTSLAAEKE
jgi:energy-coupling factor transporter ATP-binding protein EcfA2